MNYLISHGVNPAMLSAKGYGESEPVADNKTKDGRAQNRRVGLRRVN
jgi:outer membrane protein OmpA-like peptidoglycan-associated protein